MNQKPASEASTLLEYFPGKADVQCVVCKVAGTRLALQASSFVCVQTLNPSFRCMAKWAYAQQASWLMLEKQPKDNETTTIM
jgi:hypothetical protein